jgi:hypothetical protein
VSETETDTERETHSRRERSRKRHELVATLLLAVAAVATAWSTYQSVQWRGQQAVDTSRATAARVQSSEASTRAGQQTEIDIATFTQWVNATIGGDQRLATFYRQRFRSEFQPAFAAWTATQPLTNPNAPKTPFELPNYHPAEATKASALNTLADTRTISAADANRRADAYMLGVVLFATVLFFAGVATKLEGDRPRLALLGLGAVILVGTAAWILTLPVSLVA